MYIYRERLVEIGELKKDKEKRLKFSVFVENIHKNLDQFGLIGVFKKVGKVKDAFIPLKRGRTKIEFGFVRF